MFIEDVKQQHTRTHYFLGGGGTLFPRGGGGNLLHLSLNSRFPSMVNFSLVDGYGSDQAKPATGTT